MLPLGWCVDCCCCGGRMVLEAVIQLALLVVQAVVVDVMAVPVLEMVGW